MMVAENFIEAKSVDDLLMISLDFPEDSIVFLDVDDTLITPLSTTFRAPPYNQLIDEIKQHKHEYPNFTEIVSNWRLQRKAMLLDDGWPEAIVKLEENFSVYGLTKMDSGKFGNIESMEKWRINELNSFGIYFSVTSMIPEGSINAASFYKGMFMTGPNTKGQTLTCYLPYFSTKHIVLVDDRMDHLDDMRNFCAEYSIKFTGILFKGLQELQGRPDPEIAAIQKKYLIEKTQWLEDDQARLLIRGDL